MGNRAKNMRFLRSVIEDRGHEVLGTTIRKGSHGTMTVRLSDGREVSVMFSGSLGKGEKIARHLMTMQLRALERGIIPDGRRDH